MIAVCGEALVDLVPTGTWTYTALPGGSPANTAVALSRLGVPTQLLARLSSDLSGQLLRSHLLANGVDLSRAVAADEPSSIALVELAADGSASYRFLLDGTADWQWTPAELRDLAPDVLAVHAGSLALARVPELEAFLGRASCTVSIDPTSGRRCSPTSTAPGPTSSAGWGWPTWSRPAATTSKCCTLGPTPSRWLAAGPPPDRRS